MGEIDTSNVQLGWVAPTGWLKYSYEGQASYVDSLNVTDASVPLSPGGNCSTGPYANIHAPDFSLAWVTYDLGMLEYIYRLDARWYHDGDSSVELSQDGINWRRVWYSRTSWSVATCHTENYIYPSLVYNPFPMWSPPLIARYIKFREDQLVLVGDAIRLAWFSWESIGAIWTHDVELGVVPSAGIFTKGVRDA